MLDFPGSDGKAAKLDRPSLPALARTRRVAGDFSPIEMAIARKRNLGFTSPFDSATDAPNPFDYVRVFACFGVRKWAF